ncbi:MULTISPECIES: hypothetical protein [Heyndrickxia]|uniref:hypothetical protein n=1 Tax=Heyndrickxia TaxID=2837504 RepID=UPI0003485FF1|nr:hypothetical protein [Heyndrickxia coagulans]MED4934890.1 hypothetical protein [Heyndrickxia coagulans]MED4942927.1 hypothetical protein [Heyndrickxia coagulans]
MLLLYHIAEDKTNVSSKKMLTKNRRSFYNRTGDWTNEYSREEDGDVTIMEKV